ncbi:hypothetical protein TNIN_50621 [Trichonephila inaurata madagascariensis]|uniref:Uncharacterized protein n=1 Tax=Trichonephila inaurata madagascariensis TaxID=2747483 RepID=A0A8X6YN01_9ARAC|nr:hypothetical protein TNIN_50621 [Trichonephila inaurata madagascariensis]
MSDIPATLNMEDTFPFEENDSLDTSTSSSGPKTEESLSSGGVIENEGGQVDSKSDIAETERLYSESLSAGGGIENDGKQIDSISETGLLSSESLSAGGGIDNDVAQKTNEIETNLLHDRIQKASELFRKAKTFLNQNEQVQQLIKTANDPNVPFHIKEAAILVRGVVAWLNSIQNFSVLNSLFTGETGRLTSDKEKTGAAEPMPVLAKEKTGAAESMPVLAKEKTCCGIHACFG